MGFPVDLDLDEDAFEIAHLYANNHGITFDAAINELARKGASALKSGKHPAELGRDPSR